MAKKKKELPEKIKVATERLARFKGKALSLIGKAYPLPFNWVISKTPKSYKTVVRYINESGIEDSVEIFIPKSRSHKQGDELLVESWLIDKEIGTNKLILEIY